MREDIVGLGSDSLPGAHPWTYWSVKADGISDSVEQVNGGLPEETLVSLFLNGQELATLMCSPIDLEALAIGFLFNEGVVQSSGEIGLVRPNRAGTTVDVFLRTPVYNAPRRLVLTAGCGGGISFNDLSKTYEPLNTEYVTQPRVILALMHALNSSATLYQKVRGIHTSVLGNGERMLLIAEDIGRHNTIDKLCGKAILTGLPTQDCIIVTSGRISSEMLGKARQMGVPVVASRTAPTSISVELAQTWNICVIGYVRQGGMRVYTHPERLGLAVWPEAVSDD